MARVLLVGGGCRALGLVRDLAAEGHAIRRVTRHEHNREAIAEAGAECWIGDPDVVGTLRYALDNVTLLLWLLGRVPGAPDLDGSRLEMMLSKTIDTTVRGVVVQAGGEAEATTRRIAGHSEIPHRIVATDPADEAAWLAELREAVDALLR